VPSWQNPQSDKKQKSRDQKTSGPVGDTGFEPVTPALSRQCSEPTELIARFNNGLQKYELYLENQVIPAIFSKKVVQGPARLDFTWKIAECVVFSYSALLGVVSMRGV
jgi:hypothetical protein